MSLAIDESKAVVPAGESQDEAGVFSSTTIGNHDNELEDGGDLGEIVEGDHDHEEWAEDEMEHEEEGDQYLPGDAGEQEEEEEAEEEEEEPEDDFKDDYFTEYHLEEDIGEQSISNVQDLINMLAKIKLVWPEDLPDYSDEKYNQDQSRARYPEQFYHCSPKEKAVMWHAENMRRQFAHIFPDRRPLLIAPKNECETQKLFPTFINPTVIGYPEFYDPESTGKYMKDFLSPQFLRPPTRFPRLIRSHMTVLKERKANSFEYSIIIVSLLNGAGFDSYVVDGYATKEITTMCETEDYMDVEDGPRKISEADFDFTGEEEGQEEPEVKESSGEEPNEDEYDWMIQRENDKVRPVSPSKYRVKAPKIYYSQYEEAMEKRAKEKEETERLIAEKEAHEEMIKNLRPPTPDPLFGFRTHAWVMIMPGKRGIQDPFFIEPFSGLRKEITDQNFLGIEAVFNERNYWANMQDCSAGIQDISYNLRDSTKWAQLLLEPECRRNCKKAAAEDGNEEEGVMSSSFYDQEDENEEVSPCERFLDMPISWTPDLNIPQEDYERKFPQGSKHKDYNDAFTETAAPFVNVDGLIRKVIKFDGNSRDPKKLLYIEEKFAHRQDKLERRTWFRKGRELHEYFEKGRKDSLKEHVHQSGKNKAHFNRHLYYYADIHPQNVSHRQVIPNGLIEEFEGRDDLLYYRSVQFGGFLCHTVPQRDDDPKVAKVRALLDLMRGEEHGNKNKPRKKILIIEEKYYRNPDILDANQDIAEKYLLLGEGKIVVYFHYGDENFTRKSFEFYKPRGVDVNSVDFRPENCVEFQVDPFNVPTSNYEKFMILQQLAKDELRASSLARQAEDEIYHTVTLRVQEDWSHKLEPNPYAKDEKTQKEAGKEDSGEDLDAIDFATPYLEKYGKPQNKRQEIALKQKIIKDARTRILKKAHNIQKDYDEESSKLQAKMQWYDKMKDTMTPVDEADFNVFYNEILYKMHVMEERLIRHREQAPLYFNNLLLDVFRHPLLNFFTNKKHKEQKKRMLEEAAEKVLKKQQEEEEAAAKTPKDICCDYRFKFNRGPANNN